VSGRLRQISGSYVAAPPAGARVRTRLRLTAGDAGILSAAGRHLGSLASADLAARCAEGLLDAKGKAKSRARRKQALTAASTSRWAGAITRTSEDSWQLAWRNLSAERAALRSRAREIRRRLDIPSGSGRGRNRGYATPAERNAKQVRLQALTSQLAAAEQQVQDGRVSVCRGGAALARKRHNLDAAGLAAGQWRDRWEAGRMFLTADGEKDKAWGNETIRWNPDEGWLEIRLPAPLAHLANRPHARYRLACQVSFPYRGDEVAGQAATGPVRYDISFDPARDRWYLDASWQAADVPAPELDTLRKHPVLAVDLNHGFLAAWTVLPDGNPAGQPVTVPLELAGLPSSARDGRLRAAVTRLITLATAGGCHAIAVENLNFADARTAGREQTGRRPSRGVRGRRFRALVAGLPTGKFRDRLVQMTSNAGLSVIAVDPAYTSRWGKQHWLAPLQDKTPVTNGHHAAAVVIGRRAHDLRARRRPGVTGGNQRIATRRAAARAPRDQAPDRDGDPGRAQQQPQRRHPTATAEPGNQPNQAAQDRSGPPDRGNYLLLSH
jgi:hypothetical protein